MMIYPLFLNISCSVLLVDYLHKLMQGSHHFDECTYPGYKTISVYFYFHCPGEHYRLLVSEGVLQ